jgi:hypothetical protein
MHAVGSMFRVLCVSIVAGCPGEGSGRLVASQDEPCTYAARELPLGYSFEPTGDRAVWVEGMLTDPEGPLGTASCADTVSVPGRLHVPGEGTLEGVLSFQVTSATSTAR